MNLSRETHNMKTVKVIGISVALFLLISGGVFAEEKKVTVAPTNAVTAGVSKDTADEKNQKNAAIAGAAAAGVTVVGAGVAASTASAAVITSTIAAVGVGSMAVGISVIAAVPILIGAGTYGAYRWFKSEDKE